MESITKEEIQKAYRSLLNRDPENEKIINHWLNSKITFEQLEEAIIKSEEFKTKNQKKSHDFHYRAPVDLLTNEIEIENILLIGSCLSHSLLISLNKVLSTQLTKPEVDHVLINNLEPLPPALPKPIQDYSFQIIQLPLRAIMPEAFYFSLNYHDHQAYKNAFEKSVQLLELSLEQALKYHTEYNITTFVINFLTPQQNLLGRLLPKYDLRNIVYYVEELNRKLSEIIYKKNNIYVTDINEIAATFGRRYIQDDALHSSNHASIINDFDFAYDLKRIEKPIRYSQQNLLNTNGFLHAVSHEIITQYKVVSQHNQIKIVICDLDDTLWRGIFAEEGIHLVELEGWPLGLVEALLVLKKRGILLAIASKNEERTITNAWSNIFQNHLELDDFVIRKINWKEKVENIQEILKEVNLLPSNALFIDDNPVEREKVQQAFPEMRILGANLYNIRKILLWAPELQVAKISHESSQRTELTQYQLKRHELANTINREEFLASLDLNIEVNKINEVTNPDFERAFELLNKTNQFNTTGRRWIFKECADFFNVGGIFYTFKVKDKFTSYGLVGLAIVHDYHIFQLVMSCRVVGLDIEKKMLAYLINSLKFDTITANFIKSKSNLLCRNLYADCNFHEKENIWFYDKVNT